MAHACVYGSPACSGVSFKGLVGARQHWSCLPGSIFSAVVTGLGRSSPDLREDDRVLLAAVAAWGAFGATPALASSIAKEALGTGGTRGETTRALRAALDTALGADMPSQIEEAGHALLAHSQGRTTSSPQTRIVIGITELQLKPVSAVSKELTGDPSAERYVARHLGAKAQEAFWVIPIDAGRQARSIVEVGVGHYHSVGVPIPAVLSAVFASGTDLFWVAHNHPSGDVAPSQADADLTGRLGMAAQVVDLHLVDHVIVGPGASSASLVRLGLYSADWGELSGEGHEPA